MKNLIGATSKLHMITQPRIYRGDFDSHTTMYDIAEKIVTDLRYEERWRKIAKNKEIYRSGGIK